MKNISFDKFKEIIKLNDFDELITKHKLYKLPEFNLPFQIKETFDYSSVEHYKESIGDIDLSKVIGVCNPKFDSYIGNFDCSWYHSFNFCVITRKKENLLKLKGNVDFYYAENENIDMEFISFDEGLSYYVVNGNHRTFIAKFLFALERVYTGQTENTLRNVQLTFI